MQIQSKCSAYWHNKQLKFVTYFQFCRFLCFWGLSQISWRYFWSCLVVNPSLKKSVKNSRLWLKDERILFPSRRYVCCEHRLVRNSSLFYLYFKYSGICKLMTDIKLNFKKNENCKNNDEFYFYWSEVFKGVEETFLYFFLCINYCLTI